MIKRANKIFSLRISLNPRDEAPIAPEYCSLMLMLNGKGQLEDLLDHIPGVVLDLLLSKWNWLSRNGVSAPVGFNYIA